MRKKIKTRAAKRPENEPQIHQRAMDDMEKQPKSRKKDGIRKPGRISGN